MKKQLLALGLTVLTSAAMAQIPASGLVDYYDFDNNLIGWSGNVLPNASEDFVDDRFGNPLSSLDVQTQFDSLQISNLPIGNDARTVAFWFKNTDDAVHSYFNYGFTTNHFGIVYDGSDILISGASEGGHDIGYTYSENWTHIAATFNNGTLWVYLDGVFVSTAALTFTVAANPVSRIGFSPYLGDYAGFYMDNLAIYNRALSASEITELYSATTATSVSDITANPVATYPNPATTSVMLDGIETGSTITLVDALGRTVKTAIATATRTEVSLSGLNQGVYTIQVQEGNAIRTARLLVNN